ncbi:MAG: hypothetical protein J0H62_10530 [Rhizobiales bacterium]|nr:hypothetical protein [Hyphomicrobiales bacterium]
MPQIFHSPRTLASVIAAALLLALAPRAADAQTKPKVTALGETPHTAIFIGNSFFYYNNSMHNKVLGLARAADTANRGKYRATSVTISGSGIEWHDVDSYFRPDAIGRYSFDANNNVVFNKIEGRLFDVAIMMDCSQCPIHPELKSVFHDYAGKDAEIVRKHGAKPVFFMSWAYADKPEMTAELAEAYTTAGNANDALVIPAGLAFARAIARKPDLNLYAPDKRHPSPAGSYLAAATVYTTLYRKSPEGNAFTDGVPRETAQFLQTVAWETVQDYFRE